MKQDILLCGVGGQGILSLAFVLDSSAVTSGLFFKQPEVHGMAQRGGAVHAQLRVSDKPVASGLISAGGAELVLALEPMEALRYLHYVSPECRLVVDITPHVNMDDYPEPEKLYEVLFRVPGVLAVDGRHLARRAGMARAQNMVVLGAAVGHMPFSPELLERGIARLFAAKEERVLQGNLNAFRRGRAAAQFFAAMRDAGVEASVVSRVLPRLDLQPWPVPESVLEGWRKVLCGSAAAELSAAIFSAATILPCTEHETVESQIAQISQKLCPSGRVAGGV